MPDPLQTTFISNDFYTSDDLDFLFIVETWMKAVDLTPIMEVTPTACEVYFLGFFFSVHPETLVRVLALPLI